MQCNQASKISCNGFFQVHSHEAMVRFERTIIATMNDALIYSIIIRIFRLQNEHLITQYVLDYGGFCDDYNVSQNLLHLKNLLRFLILPMTHNMKRNYFSLIIL